MTVRRLIPAVPNELGELIIQHLSFQELVAGYFVSREWRDVINNDDDIRKKMFRLPKNIEQGHRYDVIEFVRDKWRNIDAEVGQEVSHQALWSRISINPLVELSYTRDIGGFYDVEYVEHHLPFWDQLSVGHKTESDDLFNSMVATYPPIARIRARYQKQEYMGPMIRDYRPQYYAEGLRLEDLLIDPRPYTIELWPEQLWRIYIYLGEGDSEESAEEGVEEDGEDSGEESDGTEGEEGSGQTQENVAFTDLDLPDSEDGSDNVPDDVGLTGGA
jgi:hypothetical protein